MLVLSLSKGGEQKLVACGGRFEVESEGFENLGEGRIEHRGDFLPRVKGDFGDGSLEAQKGGVAFEELDYREESREEIQAKAERDVEGFL